VANYTTNLVYDRLGPGITEALIEKTPMNEKGYRPNRLHQWLSEDVGNPMLATHIHSILMFQRLAIANRYGWKRFLHMVDQVLPKRGSTLELPLEFTEAKKRSNRLKAGLQPLAWLWGRLTARRIVRMKAEGHIGDFLGISDGIRLRIPARSP
jgi:hypothetical protein